MAAPHISGNMDFAAYLKQCAAQHAAEQARYQAEWQAMSQKCAGQNVRTLIASAPKEGEDSWGD